MIIRSSLPTGKLSYFGKSEKRIPVNRFYENYIALFKRLSLDVKMPDSFAHQLHSHETTGMNKLLIDLWMTTTRWREDLYLLSPETARQELEKANPPSFALLVAGKH